MRIVDLTRIFLPVKVSASGMLACDWALNHWLAVVFPTTFLPNRISWILCHPSAGLLGMTTERIFVAVLAVIFRYGADYGSFCGGDR